MRNFPADEKGIYTIDKTFISKKNNQYFQKLSALTIQTNESFDLFHLSPFASPEASILSQYQEISMTNSQNYISTLFCLFLVDCVLPALDSLSKEEVARTVFQETPSERQMQLINHLLSLYQKQKEKKLSRSQVEKELSEKYKPFENQFLQEKISSNYRKEVEWFIQQNLYYNLQILTFQGKKIRLQRLKEAFPDTVDVTLSHETERKEKPKTLILVKQNPQRSMLVEDLFLSKKYNPPVSIISPINFAMKLFYELVYFEEQFGQSYPTLSPKNILYEFQTQNINLSMVGPFMFCLGLSNTPTSPYNYAQAHHEGNRFWISPQELIRPVKVNSKTLMWNYLFLVDFYERGTSYFSSARSKQQIQQLMDEVQVNLKRGNEKTVFGPLVCSIIQYCKKQNVESWLNEKSRPPLSALKGFFHSYIPQNEIYQEMKRIYQNNINQVKRKDVVPNIISSLSNMILQLKLREIPTSKQMNDELKQMSKNDKQHLRKIKMDENGDEIFLGYTKIRQNFDKYLKVNDKNGLEEIVKKIIKQIKEFLKKHQIEQNASINMVLDLQEMKTQRIRQIIRKPKISRVKYP